MGYITEFSSVSSVAILLTVLPESRTLEFECGVKVQLGFAAEFSNIMIIYTRILDKPKDIEHCSAQLSNFSEVKMINGCCIADLYSWVNLNKLYTSLMGKAKLTIFVIIPYIRTLK